MRTMNRIDGMRHWCSSYVFIKPSEIQLNLIELIKQKPELPFLITFCRYTIFLLVGREDTSRN